MDINLWIQAWTIGALMTRYNIPRDVVESIREEARRDYHEWCRSTGEGEGELVSSEFAQAIAERYFMKMKGRE